ncbi:tRNA pseudouridine(38-40) synthase TruA [Muriicola soli]|uniref:tRNA pseudouridine synthase A n=1 Tax=Muriicola soli TaxID=2507538 RepID=A0A411E948_9FLAO|nr:tRNA pseudouridine(38-40) synthase TruA [Muriicola soli]QBA64202.1 tRNA pseudouridine(38-40) synthase TruA [Muriicola soli]
MKGKYIYIVWVQYLGFRYSGWQRQPGQKTVEGMIRKTLKFISPEGHYKVLGASRTDAKVSALKSAFQLISQNGPVKEMDEFTRELNRNLPADIRVLGMEKAREGLNIIKDASNKEYHYLFSFGSKNHPYSAPFLANFPDELDLPLMQEWASVFEGEHDFRNFTARLRPGSTTVRRITHCSIEENIAIQANFFPEKSYMLRVKGDGFMRYQIRMIMGVLVLLGKREIEPEFLQKALQPGNKVDIPYIAPASGLYLNAVELM